MRPVYGPAYERAEGMIATRPRTFLQRLLNRPGTMVCMDCQAIQQSADMTLIEGHGHAPLCPTAKTLRHRQRIGEGTTARVHGFFAVDRRMDPVLEVMLKELNLKGSCPGPVVENNPLSTTTISDPQPTRAPKDTAFIIPSHR